MTLFNIQQLKRNSRPEQILALSLFFAGKCLPTSSFLDSLFFILLVLQLSANLGENMLSKSFLCFFFTDLRIRSKAICFSSQSWILEERGKRRNWRKFHREEQRTNKPNLRQSGVESRIEPRRPRWNANVLLITTTHAIQYEIYLHVRRFDT